VGQEARARDAYQTFSHDRSTTSPVLGIRLSLPEADGTGWVLGLATSFEVINRSSVRQSDLWRGFWAGSAGGAVAVLAPVLALLLAVTTWLVLTYVFLPLIELGVPLTAVVTSQLQAPRPRS